MKLQVTIAAILITLLTCSVSRSQDTLTNTVANFIITENGTKFSFDIFTLRTSESEMRMGNASYYLRFVAGTFGNPELTYINPKYTSGSVSLSYNEMTPFEYVSGRVAVQIYYNGVGDGDIISDIPGGQGFGEKIATVRMDILTLNLPDLRWDAINSGVANPQFMTAFCNYNGSYNSPLPVELSSFTASVSGNSVDLKWSTFTEENNAGFEIQRKSQGGDWERAGYVNGNGNTSEERHYSFKDRNLETGEYDYRLKQIDVNGNYEFHELTGEVEIGTPENFVLHQNYPNPFNPSTTIAFDLPYDARVTLLVYDISGREVARLIDNEQRAANYYLVNFNASSLSSGVYFYELRTGAESKTKKLALVK